MMRNKFKLCSIICNGVARCKPSIPTQSKATQLVVAMAVWAIPGGASITYRSEKRLQPIDSTSQKQKHQNNIVLLLDSNACDVSIERCYISIVLLDDNALILLGNIML
jgi:hypothetical protein